MLTFTEKHNTPALAIDAPGWIFFPQANVEDLTADSIINLQCPCR